MSAQVIQLQPTRDVAEPAALRARTVALFGLGDWGPSTTSTAVMFFLPFFLTDIARLAPHEVALVLLVGGAWDALAVPLVGALTDRVRTRWGRRRPFLLLGAVPFALAFSALWWIPPVSGALRTAWFALAYVLFDTAFACVQVPYTALTPEISPRPRDRTHLNAARAVVSMLGGLVAAACVPLAVRGFARPAQGYHTTMTLVGIAGALPFVLLALQLRERPQVHPPALPGVFADVRDLTRSPTVRRVAGIYFLAWVVVSLVAAMFEYYLTHAMGMGPHLERVLGLVQLSALASVPLVAWSSERWGRARTLAVGALGWSLVMIGLAVLPAGRVAMGYVLAALVGPGIAAAHVVPWTLVTDAVDADALETGRRREGAVYGLLGLLQKGGAALVLASAQGVLGKVGYVAGAVQSSRVQTVLRVLFGVVPAVLLLLLAARMTVLHVQGASRRR